MKLSLEEDLNRIDSKELFSQLVGRIVINHEHINSLVRDLVYLLFRDLATFSRTHMHDLPQDLTSATPEKVNEKLIASSQANYFNHLRNRLISQNSTSSEVRSSCIDLATSFNDFCRNHEFGHAAAAKEIPSLLGRLLASENAVRNSIVHSTFKFSGNAEKVTKVQMASTKRFEPKKIDYYQLTDSKLQTNELDQSEFLEFIGFQMNLIAVIELFNFDVRDDGYLFFNSTIDDFVGASGDTIEYFVDAFMQLESHREKLKIITRNKIEIDAMNFHDYL